MILYKYHGAGNDFLIGDNRNGECDFDTRFISRICDRHIGFGADGIMFLENSNKADFSMKYYNSDGSGGMMCGNGGRCIVAFASDLGYTSFNFEAPDGLHRAEMLKTGNPKIVRLKLKDVSDVVKISNSEYFLDTGTKHYVSFVSRLGNYDVVGEGRVIRNAPRFAPEGTNADFVEVSKDKLLIRTFEKGVEGETLACGTGIVASAIASYMKGVAPVKTDTDGRCYYRLKARIDELSVDFYASSDKSSFSDIWLTGPAEYIGKVEI